MIKEIKIETDYIKLDQLLKYASIVQTGGHAKNIIKNGQVKVNGEIMLQRGKKIRKGDKVEVIGGSTLVIK
ncbi:MAG: RNA-binding S4 domain-containing protein [Firmicutes bacterium]|nr:RNA-binding S4 domain-containing protein [Bacillota bacterium]